jgi:hypothetical protein
VNKYAKLKLNRNIRNSKQIADIASVFADETFVARGPNSYPVEFIEVEES